jgi:hypothetical protein
MKNKPTAIKDPGKGKKPDRPTKEDLRIVSSRGGNVSKPAPGTTSKRLTPQQVEGRRTLQRAEVEGAKVPSKRDFKNTTEESRYVNTLSRLNKTASNKTPQAKQDSAYRKATIIRKK